ncbi:hypothetical protein [bacterium endosymbiont of Bathymodiolus sp. 5 South]|uniref:hypothetical protein n=1 Tax=bacterium endosymbiont of Bathymodiolus sp. 5 South TaxID=1181670 RepID=UPI0010B36ECF|nr:hypothetical protein [bacterium endosymbiont of Bathymodiolus sp. 5 South]SSC08846.1 hypothetical protein BTURTLESOX_533 [bacterium endosymbiont of Bathymodiolus sp. 5 South]
MISLNLVLAGLRLGLKNRQVGEKWVLMIVPIYAKVLNRLRLFFRQQFNRLVAI